MARFRIALYVAGLLAASPAAAQQLSVADTDGDASGVILASAEPRIAPRQASERRRTAPLVSVGFDTVAGAPRYADRTVSENGVSTVRFSAVRPVTGGSSGVSGAIPRGLPTSRARLTSGFGYRVNPVTGRYAMHSGVDIAMATGTPVGATSAGRVARAGWAGGYGLLVVIDHGGGIETYYAHLSSLSVRAGDTVQAGQTLGGAGSTGRSTGPHLHYELRVGGRPVDPLSS